MRCGSQPTRTTVAEEVSTARRATRGEEGGLLYRGGLRTARGSREWSETERYKLNSPCSVTEYWNPRLLSRFIANAGSIRAGTKMPSFDSLPETDIQVIVGYLRSMASHKKPGAVSLTVPSAPVTSSYQLHPLSIVGVLVEEGGTSTLLASTIRATLVA
jgi:hypothetical protein